MAAVAPSGDETRGEVVRLAPAPVAATQVVALLVARAKVVEKEVAPVLTKAASATVVAEEMAMGEAMVTAAACLACLEALVVERYRKPMGALGSCHWRRHSKIELQMATLRRRTESRPRTLHTCEQIRALCHPADSTKPLRQGSAGPFFRR